MHSDEIRHSDGELIDLIYAAMLGEAPWQQFLDRLSDNVPEGRTIMFSHNVAHADEYLALAARFDGPELETYASHYVDTNPWLDHCAMRKVGLSVHSEHIVPWNELIKTEFFNDWLSPNDIASSIGVTIDKHGDCPLILTTVSSRADPELEGRFSDQLTRIAPHLRRAARFYRNGPARWAGFDVGVSLFDAVDVGVVVVGEDRRIKTVSSAGQQLLDGGRTMSVSPLGQLRLRSEEARSVLREMLKRTYAGQKTVSLFLDGFKLTLISVEKDRISLYFEGPTVAILIQPPDTAYRAIGLDQLGDLWGLTRSERRALSGIVDGKTVTQIADDAALSRETIRTQIKSLHAKTGTRSQSDLLRLVHQLRTEAGKTLS